MLCEAFDTSEDFADDPSPDIGRPLFNVPGLDILEIAEGRFGQTDENRHASFKAESGFRFMQRRVPPFRDVGQTAHDRAQKGALFFDRLVFAQRLYDGDATPPTGEKNRAA